MQSTKSTGRSSPPGRRVHPPAVYLWKRLPLPSDIPRILDYRLAELNSTILDSKIYLNYSLAKAASSPMKLSTITMFKQHFGQHLAMTKVVQNHPLPSQKGKGTSVPALPMAASLMHGLLMHVGLLGESVPDHTQQATMHADCYPVSLSVSVATDAVLSCHLAHLAQPALSSDNQMPGRQQCCLPSATGLWTPACWHD